MIKLTDSSRKHQIKELQERLDDTVNLYPQKRGRVALEQANLSQQIVELQDQIGFSNVGLQNEDAREEKMEALLDNCEGIGYAQCQLIYLVIEF